MSFFISDALAVGETVAAGAAAVEGPGWQGLAFPLGILFFFYILFIRPQQKKGKEQKKMIGALTKGAEVVTNGGMLGRVVSLDDNFVQLDVGNNTVVQIQRQAVQNLMPKGTFKVQSKRLNNS